MIRRAPYRYFILCLVFAFSLPAQTLFRDGAIVPMTDGVEYYANGWVLISADGYIRAIGEGTPSEEIIEEATKVVSLDGKILMPGFVSGHSHLWQSAFRGIAPDGDLWEWLNALHWTYGDDLVAGDMEAFTAHGAWDQLTHGVTTTYNHSHWLDHDLAIFWEQFEGEKTVPQRFIFSSCVDFSSAPEEWKSHIEKLQSEVEKTPGSNVLDIAMNLRQYRPPALIKGQVDLAAQNDLRYQLHYLEASNRQEKGRADWPRFKELGIPTERATFAHFIHVDETILEEAAEVGAGMIWNPLSNGRLGSGLPDIEAYLEAGLKVGMGVDGQASADISDPFENMRMGLYATRMRNEHSKGLQPIDMLRLHTIETAKTLGVEKYIGSLEVGKFGDFIIVDTTAQMTGPIWDIPAHLVFACSSKNIEAIFVGGKKVVSNGDPIRFDLAELDGEVNTRILALRDRHLAKEANPN